VEITVVPVHTVKREEGGSRNITPLILNIGNRLRQVFGYSLRPIYLGSTNPLLPNI